MSSGESRTPRRKTRNEVQGSLDGLLGEPDEREKHRSGLDEDATVGPEPAPKPARRASRRARPTSGDGGGDRLRASLDALEESVKLLLARHEEAVEARAAAEARGSAVKSLDPVALQERVRELETETDRLERHAAFLEDRIRGLLSRVRYVIES